MICYRYSSFVAYKHFLLKLGQVNVLEKSGLNSVYKDNNGVLHTISCGASIILEVDQRFVFVISIFSAYLKSLTSNDPWRTFFSGSLGPLSWGVRPNLLSFTFLVLNISLNTFCRYLTRLPHSTQAWTTEPIFMQRYINARIFTPGRRHCVITTMHSHVWCSYRGGARRGQGGGGPLWFFFFFFLLVSSAVGHGHDNTSTPFWKIFGNIFEVGKKMCWGWATFSGIPPPPPKQTPWRRPCAHTWPIYTIGGNQFHCRLIEIIKVHMQMRLTLILRLTAFKIYL